MCSIRVLIDKFPDEWIEIFATICSKAAPLKHTEMWYQQRKCSRLGLTLTFSDFIEACVETEPVVQNGRLEFVIRILCFPKNIKRLLLAFVQHHQADVTTRLLQQLVDGIDSYTRDNDQVVAHLHQLMLEHLKNKTELAKSTDLSQTLGDMQEECEMEYHTPDNSQRRPMSQPNTSEPLPKRLKLDMTPGEIEPSFMYDEERSATDRTPGTSGDTLSKNIMEQTTRLHEVIHSAADGNEARAKTKFLSNCTNEEIESICGLLKPVTFPESAMAALCKNLCEEPNLSYFCTSHFAKELFLPKIRDMTASPTRTLLGAFHLFAKRYPKQMVESVIVRCMLSRNVGTHQSDLIIKMCKESFGEEILCELITMYTDASSVDASETAWSEGLLAIMQVLVHNKVAISPNSMGKLLAELEQNSFPHAKNLKFGKFILAIVTKHAKQLTVSQMAQLVRIADNHQTFMKKSIESALRKAT